MKTENKLFNKVMIYLLILLCIISISINFTFYGVQSVQSVQESFTLSLNNECTNSGDGNNNTLINKRIDTILNRINSNGKSNILFHVASIFSMVILFIQISEFYFYEQAYLLTIHTRTLIVQKVRLNN